MGYISEQLPGEDFSIFYNTFFSRATKDYYFANGLAHIKLKKQEAAGPSVLKFPQLRLMLDRSLEKQGAPVDRDIMAFMLNHSREDLFPGDERISQALQNYFEFRFEDTTGLNLQWLMDLQKFVEKKFIPLDTAVEDKIKTDIDFHPK